MKIIIPYDRETFFTLEEHSILQALELKDTQVLDEALSNWTVYAHSSIEHAHDRALEEMSYHIEMTHRDSDHGIRLQHVLDLNADGVAQMMKHTAIKLHQLLYDLPHQLEDLSRQTEEYHFLKVESINPAGKYAVIASNITDT